MWQKLKQLIWEWRGVWISGPSMTGLIILLRLTSLLQSWELAVFDQYLRLRPLEPPDERIVIVGIDENDLKKIGQAIIPDQVYAQLLTKLKAMKPRAIGLDIYRDLPVEPGHQELVEVFESTPNLIGIEKVIGDQGLETVSPPPVLKEKGQVGANDTMLDTDNKVRRGFIKLNAHGENIPSFSMYLAALYLEAEGITIKLAEGTDNWWQLGEAVFVPFKANDGGYVRADDGDYQILFNYRGGNRYFETVSMRAILEDKIPPDWGRDRIILIGNISESGNDLFAVPYTKNPSQRMAGVEIHANLVSQILSTVLENRPLLKTWSDLQENLWIFLWATVAAALSWRMRHADGGKKISLHRASLFMVAAMVLLGSTYTAYSLSGWWIPVIPPFLAMGGAVISITIYIARTAGEIRKTFGRYLSNEIVATLLESPEGLELGGQRRKITLLTSDLRGFTATSERLPPEEVVKILNFYLGYMADVITHHQGTIDEFMGDGILVLFGAPISRKDDATRAIACAVEMQLAMEPVNQKMKEWGLPPLEMGIGINTGEVVVGNIGSEKRTKYGVVGSQVNLTYRIESYTIGGQIIISATTLKESGSIVKINGQKQVTPKGVKEPITIYDVAGIEGEYNLFLSQEEEIFLPLAEAIPLQYSVLEGKDISKDVSLGQLVKLSSKGAQISFLNKEVSVKPSN
ncbi:MAG: adenylate/guanylate cyclase domain-containing protein, partial [Moorea sp. SIO2B7]|nr:adenylate/guanylate cyclase domain-containing protein [Moorena sp. SIO2B7]